MAPVVMWALAVTEAVAQPLDWKNGELGHLSVYIGTSNYGAVLEDEVVIVKLQRMLGSNFPLLQERLTVHPPIGFSGRCLELNGNARRQGGNEMAYLAVCPSNGDIEVAIASRGHVDVYASTENYAHLEAGTRAWISYYQDIVVQGAGVPTHVTLISR